MRTALTTLLLALALLTASCEVSVRVPRAASSCVPPCPQGQKCEGGVCTATAAARSG